MSDSKLSAERRAEIIADMDVLCRRVGGGGMDSAFIARQTAFLRDAAEPDFFRYVDHMCAGQRATLLGMHARTDEVRPLREGEHERRAVVRNPAGFHHRPSIGVIRIASEHAVCEVHLVANGKSIRIWNPTTQTGSVIGVFMLVPTCGVTVTVRALGDGAAELVERIGRFIEDYRDRTDDPFV